MKTAYLHRLLHAGGKVLDCYPYAPVTSSRSKIKYASRVILLEALIRSVSSSTGPDGILSEDTIIAEWRRYQQVEEFPENFL